MEHTLNRLDIIKYLMDLFLDPRRLFNSTETTDLLNMTHDHDEDKYKRRPAMQWFFRWFQ